MSSPSTRLLQATQEINQQILSHPFVRGIGAGDLPREPFVFYIRQDYLYLIEYSRALALGVARSHELRLMELFAELVHSTLRFEMELHRGYCERFDISREDLAATEIAPATHSYTRHLLSVAYSGTTAELMAALLPCQWGYWEIGKHLAAQGLPSDAPLYREWIEMYSGSEFGDLARELRDTFDQVAERCSADEWSRVSEIFRMSSRYEYGFWDSAYHMRTWPV